MKLNNAIRTTKIILISVIGILLIWDIYVAVRGLWDATISRNTMRVSEKFPFIANAWGFLGSHFFNSRIGRKLFSSIPKIRYYIWIPIAVLLLILSIVNLFAPIAFVKLQCEWTTIALFIGLAIGLLWYQEKK